MKTLRLMFITLTALVFAATGLQAHAAAHAAKIVYAFGQVQATGATGKGRQLRKGDQIFPGETVATARGRAQIKFTDGGFASLQPNTQYKIDDYNFAGKADGKERSCLSLIKGSVRLVTGVIGRANRNNFRLKTKVATIGIRGTLGKASHGDSDCGNLPVGTYMQGYGGTWDLKTGSFSGLVESRDAYLCDGTTCNQVQGGITQREEVGDFEDEEDDDRYQQGEQVDRDGILCDLGGACGDTLMLRVQIGAEAFQGSPGDADTFDSLTVVWFGGVPIAGIVIEDEFDESDISIKTINFDALRSAVNTFPDPEIVALGNLVLDQVDAETLADFRMMPASVATEDFGTTSDGILTKGRWTDGHILEVEAFLDSDEVFVTLRRLTGFQSEHFIYEPDPGIVPTGGSASYHFTGGTFSTATDGSSIGQGVTDGMLTWDFGLASGTIDMTVIHGPEIFDVMGSLLGSGTRTFFEDSVTALSGGMSYGVFLHGFFAGPNPGAAPHAAGLGYVIDMFSSRGFDLIGTAGFGLWSDDTSSTAAAGLLPLATGAYVAASHAFIDNFGGMDNNSNGWDFIVDGVSNVASLTGTNLTSFSTDFHPGLCTPPCTFAASGAPLVESGRMPTIGASWERWNTGHSLVNSNSLSELGHAHIIRVDAPTDPTTLVGTGTYSVPGGGTKPTVNYGPSGGTFEEASVWTHMLTVNFATGAKTATHDIDFPSGLNVFLTGGITTPLSTTNSVPYGGDLTAPGISCTGCVFGHDHFTFAGSNGEYVVGSGQFNTSPPGTPTPDAFAGAFSFILGDSAR